MTAIVTVVQRDEKVRALCVDDVPVGTLTVEEHVSFWTLTDHGTALGLDIPSCRVLGAVTETLVRTLMMTVERQLVRLGAGSALTDEDRNLLYPELQAYLDHTSFLVLRHPLVYAVPYGGSPHEAAMANARFEHVSYRLKEEFEAQRWSSYVFLHERPYRLEAFSRIMDSMADVEYWELLAQVWIDSENIHQNFELWQDFWASERLGREYVMDEAEREALEALPRTLTLYRGTAVRTTGLSWTLNKETAHWFGKRFLQDEYYYLATAEVGRDDVLAYLLGRSESEIVVLPSCLRTLTYKRIRQEK